MTERSPSPPLQYHGRRVRPWWVTTGLAGIRTRGGVIGYLSFALLLAIVSPIVAVMLNWPWAWFGVGFVFAAAWYWACLRWVDRHDQWT